MELEVTVDRLVVNSHDSSIVVQVLSTSSTVDHCQRDRLVVPKFSKSGVWDKAPGRSAIIFEDTHISLQLSVG